MSHIDSVIRWNVKYKALVTEQINDDCFSVCLVEAEDGDCVPEGHFVIDFAPGHHFQTGDLIKLVRRDMGLVCLGKVE